MTVEDINNTEEVPSKTVYFNPKGKDTEDPSEGVAKKFTYSGGSKYFILSNRRTRDLFKPNRDKLEDKSYRRGEDSAYIFSPVPLTYFNVYLEYLSGGEDYLYKQANRYRR